MFLKKLIHNGFRAAGALLLTASGLVHAQVSISQLPPANLPLKSTDAIIVNQTISGVKTTRQSPLSSVTGGLTSHFVLQAPDPTLLQSRTLTGTVNQVIITDGGALGNLTLSLPQSIAPTSSPTFTGLTLSSLTGILKGNGASPISIATGVDIPAAGADTQVQYNNSGVLGANSNFTYTSGSDTLQLGSSLVPGTFAVGTCAGMTISGVALAVPEFCGNSNIQGNMELHSFTSASAAAGSFFYGVRARNTIAAPAAVQNGDNLLTIGGAGFDGTNYDWGAHIHFLADGIPGLNSMPGAIDFQTTPSASNTPISRLLIDHNGSFSVQSSQGVLGNYLRSAGTGATVWSTLTLPNTATTGDLLAASGANAIGNIADVSVGSYLRSGGAGTLPLWSTVKIPNTAILGDIWYGSAGDVISALAGNITTTKQFLTQTGSGAVSAAPAWGTIAAGDLPGSFSGFANPTASVGLTAVNGAATTAMRSDAAPALSQAIAPTWTANHAWSQSSNTSLAEITATNTSTGTTAQNRLRLANSTNGFDMGITGTGFTGSPFSGSGQPTGEQAYLNTSSANPIVFATNGVFRGQVGPSGNWTMANATSGTTLALSGVQTISVNSSSSALTSTNVGAVPAGQFSNDGSPVASASTYALSVKSQTNGVRINVGSTSAHPALAVLNEADSVSVLTARADGSVLFPSVSTTASAANAFLDNANNNNLLRSTSSMRYKKDITTMIDPWEVVSKLRPVRFHSLASADSHTAWFYGLVAEEVATVEPSLIVKDVQGRPDGVQYDRVQIFLLPVVQSMHRQLQWLWACIALLVIWNAYLTIKCRSR